MFYSQRIDDGSDSTDTKLFVPDHAHSKEGIVQSKDNLTRCIGPGCAAMATKPSIYCGDACIERHVVLMCGYHGNCQSSSHCHLAYCVVVYCSLSKLVAVVTFIDSRQLFNCRHVERTLKKLSDRGVSIQQTTASDYVKGAGGVTVFEPATRKILTGLAAPGRKLLVPWIKAHPSYKVFLSSVKGRSEERD